MRLLHFAVRYAQCITPGPALAVQPATTATAQGCASCPLHPLKQTQIGCRSPLVAVLAGDEGGHGLIRGARLHLVVRALALLAAAALELVRAGLARLACEADGV